MLLTCATDRRYAEMTGVLIASLSQHTHTAPLECVIFGDRLRAEDKQRLTSCAGAGVSLRFHDLDMRVLKQLRKLPTKRHLNSMAYARLVIPELLAERTGRMLYLDCDMVVCRSIDTLFESPMKGKPIAATHVATAPEYRAEYNLAIGRPADMPYFNSGLMLIDLDEWHRRKIGERGLDYAASRTGPIIHHDQAVLNKLVGDAWVAIDERWNTSPSGLTLEQAEKIFILHYKGRDKPFHSYYPHPALTIYDQYRKITPWADAVRLTAREQRRLDTRMKWERSMRKRLPRFLRDLF